MVRFAPKLLATDLCYAEIHAVRTVMAQTLHVLEDYHLNLNQTKNVASFQAERGKTCMSHDMNIPLSFLGVLGHPWST